MNYLTMITIDDDIIEHQLEYENTLNEGFTQLNKIKGKDMINELKYPKLEIGFFEGIEDENTIVDKINSLSVMLLDSVIEKYDDDEFEEILNKYESDLIKGEEEDQITKAIKRLKVYKKLKW